jgi:hypothetical protein
MERCAQVVDRTVRGATSRDDDIDIVGTCNRVDVGVQGVSQVRDANHLSS